MSIIKIIKIILIVAVISYILWNRFKKDDEISDQNDFLSIHKPVSSNRLQIPKSALERFYEIKNNYSWDSYDQYDNKFYEYAELLEPEPNDDDLSFDDIFYQLSKPQRTLLTLTVFDSQVSNGGVYQFFWNRTELIYAVLEALDEVNLERLTTDYKIALQELESYSAEFINDRTDWANENNSDEEKWNAFKRGYEYVPSGKKIENYLFETAERRDFHKSISDYIEANIGDFISGN